MRAVIIGAGVGGMVSALRLAYAGHSVTVLEQGPRTGGKLNTWQPNVPGAGKFRFDTGPHVLTMPWAIDELFSDVGERMDDFLSLVRVDPLCRYHFADAPFFDAPAEVEAAAAAISARFPGDEAGFRTFLEYAKAVSDVTVDAFLRQDFGRAVRGIPSGRQWKQLAGFIKLAPWKTLHAQVTKHITHPKLRQIFDLYAFYNGSSPFAASGIFSIIAWVQWGDGTFYLQGGLRTYADALQSLCEKRGVRFVLSTKVKRVCVEDSGNAACVSGVEDEDGTVYPADAVICNGDPLTAYSALLPIENRPPVFSGAGLAKLQPSTSAFVWLLGVQGEARTDYAHLSHYNSFLPQNGDAEFAALFNENRAADDPVIGITCQSVSEPSCAPPGYTNLFVMTSPPPLPAGANDAAQLWNAENTQAYREKILCLLETRCGLPDLRQKIVCEQIWTPQTFVEKYGAFRGSLYGLSSNGWRSAFLRPPTRAKEVSGLYFVGGGTHPGGGLPLVTLGGKIVAESVMEDYKNSEWLKEWNAAAV